MTKRRVCAVCEFLVTRHLVNRTLVCLGLAPCSVENHRFIREHLFQHVVSLQMRRKYVQRMMKIRPSSLDRTLTTTSL